MSTPRQRLHNMVKLRDIEIARLKNDNKYIQCIVSEGLLPKEIPFGHTQCPSLVDYADNVDTVDFLLKI